MDNSDTFRGLPATGQNEAAVTAPAAPAPDAAHVEIDDSKTTADYANFCRLAGMPEEVLIDFGLNPQPAGIPTHPVVVSQRVVTSWYTAKRLLHVLQLTVQRHEDAFGFLETDVQKRVDRR